MLLTSQQNKSSQPKFGLAKETTLVLYAAYLSNEKGKRINLTDEQKRR